MPDERLFLALAPMLALVVIAYTMVMLALMRGDLPALKRFLAVFAIVNVVTISVCAVSLYRPDALPPRAAFLIAGVALGLGLELARRRNRAANLSQSD